jgi:hypothetical protein
MKMRKTTSAIAVAVAIIFLIVGGLRILDAYLLAKDDAANLKVRSLALNANIKEVETILGTPDDVTRIGTFEEMYTWRDDFGWVTRAKFVNGELRDMKVTVAPNSRFLPHWDEMIPLNKK